MPYYPQSPGFYPPLNSVTDAQLADMPDGTVKGREIGSGVGDPANIGRALSYRNILGRNGGFEVWQRFAGGGAGVQVNAGGGAYTADGWYLNATTGHNCFAGQQGPLTNGSRYSAYITRLSGQGGAGNNILFEFPLDTDEIFAARGQIVTLSFTAMAGATFSAAGSLLVCQFTTGTAAPAKLTAVGFTGGVDVIPGTNVVLATTPGRFTLTSSIVVPLNATQASVLFYFNPVGTAGASDGFFIDDVQLEIGSVATPFERRPFESELLACRRHYYKTFPYATAPAAAAGYLGALTFTQIVTAGQGQITTQPYPVEMRVNPTVSLLNPVLANGLIRGVHAAVDWPSTASDAGFASAKNIAIGGIAPAGSVPAHYGSVHIVSDAGI